MASTTRLPRRDATRLPRREPTVQLRTDPELRIRPQFKLPDLPLLVNWSFGGLFSSFPTTGRNKHCSPIAFHIRISVVRASEESCRTDFPDALNSWSDGPFLGEPTSRRPVPWVL